MCADGALASRHPAGDRRVGDGLGHRLSDVAIKDAGDDVVGVQFILGNGARYGMRGRELHLLVDRARAHVERAPEDAPGRPARC